jgi:hypothetical protein
MRAILSATNRPTRVWLMTDTAATAVPTPKSRNKA